MRGATSWAEQKRSAEPFQLTRPMRGATSQWIADKQSITISTHTPHAGRDWIKIVTDVFDDISTHTPHAGRDFLHQTVFRAGTNFNSHAPCGARRASKADGFNATGFQLTRPMRGATRHRGREKGTRSYFNSHAPCGARHRHCREGASQNCISTHTPHAGRDSNRSKKRYDCFNFNSHAPCGAQRPVWCPTERDAKFQLTRPMRGATKHAVCRSVRRGFQLTRPMRGATVGSRHRKRLIK